MPAQIAWWPTIIVATLAALIDLRCQRIPNWLVFPFIAAGLVGGTIFGGWTGLGHSFGGMLAGLAFMVPFYLLGGMGMGDVKLCASVGAWIGPHQLVFALVFMGLIGGIMAFAWAIFGGFLKDMLTGTGDLIFGLGKRGLRPHETLVLRNPKARKMPYAPAIAIGTVLSFFAIP